MIERKLLVSLLVVGVAGAAATSGTLAYFSDTEASTGNTFTAGSIDAQLFDATTETGEEVFRVGGSPRITVSDIKPGDTKSKDYVGFKVTDNPSYVCLAVTDVRNRESGNIEPEKDVGDRDSPQGELLQFLEFSIYEEPDSRKVETFTEPVSEGVYEVVDSDYSLFSDLSNSAAYPAGRTEFLSVQVSMPNDDGQNVAQTDRVTADLALYATQARNREEFQCSSLTVNEDGEIVRGEEKS